MSVAVVTAVSDPSAEAQVVGRLADRSSGVTVVRRCVDLADLLAAASAGLARAALVSADLRRLDGDALTRLAVAGVAVVGLAADGDEAARHRLHQLGVTVVISFDATADALGGAVQQALGVVANPGSRRDLADPVADLRQAHRVEDGPTDTRSSDTLPPLGRIVAVWGPAGAPGRSTIASTVATELAQRMPTLLIDADVYGGAAAQLLGVLDEAPGLAAACRLANSGTLDLAALAELAVQLPRGPRVLTGIVRADRWPELRPSALVAVLGLARALAEIVVVDCGFNLEQDEELSYDTVAPRRNGATLAVLDEADLVLGVARADPVGLHRYIRGVQELREAVPTATLTTVVNRIRRGAIGRGDARREIAEALERYTGITDVCFVPDDAPAVDAAAADGRALHEVAERSPARLALRDIAFQAAGVAAPAPVRRSGRRS